MAKSRDNSQIQSTDVEGMKAELNFILQRLTDRLDKLEGLRDSFDSQSDGNFDGAVTAHTLEIHDDTDTVVHSLGEN